MTAAVAVRPISLAISPSGRPRVVDAPDGEDALAGERAVRASSAFARGGAGGGILHLGAAEVGTDLPPPFAYFRELGHELVARACAQSELETLRERVRIEPPLERLEAMVASAPPMPGAEYLTTDALAGLWREANERSPRPWPAGGDPWLTGSVSLALYVDDVDAFVARAASHGAVVERAPRDEFYGDRTGILVDPFGHRWMIHSRREIVSPDEMRRRMQG